MWDLLGGLGILALCILGGAWVMVQFMDEGERFDSILSVLPPAGDDDDTDPDVWDRDTWWLVDDDSEPKWSGQ